MTFFSLNKIKSPLPPNTSECTLLTGNTYKTEIGNVDVRQKQFFSRNSADSDTADPSSMPRSIVVASNEFALSSDIFTHTTYTLDVALSDCVRVTHTYTQSLFYNVSITSISRGVCDAGRSASNSDERERERETH